MPWLDLLFLAAAGVFALRPLAEFWSNDPNYSFGWAVPFLAAYLFFQRWRCAPRPIPSTGSPSWFIIIVLVCATAYLVGRMLLESVPDWRPGLWFCASLYAGALLAWCWLRGGRGWARHFLTPVAFLLLGVPWLYNLETPVVEGLMRWNAVLVADTLVLADIPVRAAGNVLLLPTGRLGVEEACSGIRSLQAALMMAVFLGEFYRLQPRRRAWPVLAAAFLAFLGNYARLLFLAWNGARHGIPSVTRLHDSAAAGILAFTVFGLWLFCLALGRGERHSPNLPPAACGHGSISLELPASRHWAFSMFLALALIEIFTQGWFAWRQSGLSQVSNWTIHWRDDFPVYTETPVPPVTHDLLRDEKARAGAWTDARGWHWHALWFVYPPRTANRIAFDLHNPEVCLTSIGYRETRDYGEFDVRAGDRVVPVRAYLFSGQGTSAYVFWMASANQSTWNPVSHSTEIIYGQTSSAFLARVLLWEGEAWRGVRELGSQTLEVSITRAPDFAQAQRAFVQFANTIIVPRAGAVPP